MVMIIGIRLWVSWKMDPQQGTGMVEPERAGSLATKGTGLAGIVYIAAIRCFPVCIRLRNGGFRCPFATALQLSSVTEGAIISASTASRLTSLGLWMMLAGQAGVRAANDGTSKAGGSRYT